MKVLPQPVACAVVIAAGAGTRLRETSNDDSVVKPATLLLGVPILIRTLRTLFDEGVEEAVVVTGYRASEVEDLLAGTWRRAGRSVRFVHNPEWPLKNGLSVLAAREAVGNRDFFLSMADHVYDRAVVRTLRAAPPAAGEIVLAVDRRVDEVSDPEDAMWVRLDGEGRIRDIGKSLVEYDAVDTGVFLATTALFEALARERDERGGDCALADGVRRLAVSRSARTIDIGDAWWQDVDTRANLEAAERKLAAAAADAPVSAASGP